MIKLERPLVSFDLETTGTKISEDKIVSIAATKYHPDGSIEKRSMILDPGIPIPKAASDVHGITDEKIAELKASGVKVPLFDLISKALRAFMSDCDFTGFNIMRFDIPMLAEEFTRVGIDFPNSDQLFLDSCVIYHKMNERTLSDAYNHYIGETMVGAHEACADVEAASAVLIKQMEVHAAEIGTTAKEIATFCEQFKRIDLAGKFMLNDDGFVIFSFGKHKDKLVREVFKTDHGYFKWFMKSDFSTNTKAHAQRMYDLIHKPKS